MIQDIFDLKPMRNITIFHLRKLVFKFYQSGASQIQNSGQNKFTFSPRNQVETFTGFAYLCKTIIFIQSFEGYYKIIFETTVIFCRAIF